MNRRYDRIAAWLLTRKKGAHIAVVLLTLLMIPGAMTALQPIDMESYEMESPELTAQTMINEEFPNSEIILGFLVSTRDPSMYRPLRTGNPSPEWPMERPITALYQLPLKCSNLVNPGAELTLQQEGF